MDSSERRDQDRLSREGTKIRSSYMDRDETKGRLFNQNALSFPRGSQIWSPPDVAPDPAGLQFRQNTLYLSKLYVSVKLSLTDFWGFL